MTDQDTTKALRIAMVVELLNKKSPYGGVTLKEMADFCNVSIRSILRYLEKIENEMRIPLVRPQKNTSRKHGLYRLDAGYLPSISPEKALIIFLSLLQQKGSVLAGHTNELKDALVGTLFNYKYTAESLCVEELQNRVYIVEEQLADSSGVSKIFARLLQSLRDCCRVKLWYYAGYNRQCTERVVEPYGLISKRHNWYLVANCLKRNDIRVFRVDQIKSIFPYTNERFEYPPGFSLKEYMAESWGISNDGNVCKVRLKFSPEVNHRVKRFIYHPSQETEQELDDGSLILSFEACGLAELKTWIFQWGNAVEVLEPDWLRETICEMANNLLKVYK
jgi:proteasome accessory factor B